MKNNPFARTRPTVIVVEENKSKTSDKSYTKGCCWCGRFIKCGFSKRPVCNSCSQKGRK